MLSDLEGKYLLNRFGNMFCVIPKEVVNLIRLNNSLGLLTELPIVAKVECGCRNSINRMRVGDTPSYLFYLRSLNGKDVKYGITGREVERSTWEFKVRNYDA